MGTPDPWHGIISSGQTSQIVDSQQRFDKLLSEVKSTQSSLSFKSVSKAVASTNLNKKSESSKISISDFLDSDEPQPSLLPSKSKESLISPEKLEAENQLKEQLSNQKPSMALFKAVFDSDDDSDDE
jgi:hypothetical protein